MIAAYMTNTGWSEKDGKRTKHNKQYWIAAFTDASGKPCVGKGWGPIGGIVKDRILYESSHGGPFTIATAEKYVKTTIEGSVEEGYVVEWRSDDATGTIGTPLSASVLTHKEGMADAPVWFLAVAAPPVKTAAAPVPTMRAAVPAPRPVSISPPTTTHTHSTVQQKIAEMRGGTLSPIDDTQETANGKAKPGKRSRPGPQGIFFREPRFKTVWRD